MRRKRERALVRVERQPICIALPNRFFCFIFSSAVGPCGSYVKELLRVCLFAGSSAIAGMWRATFPPPLRLLAILLIAREFLKRTEERREKEQSVSRRKGGKRENRRGEEVKDRESDRGREKETNKRGDPDSPAAARDSRNILRKRRERKKDKEPSPKALKKRGCVRGENSTARTCTTRCARVC